MRKLLAVCVAMIAVAAVSSNAMAGDKASTDELPAALQALGVDQSRILSTQEAQEVRGEAFAINIAINVTGPGFASALNLQSGAVNSITIVASPTPQTLLGIAGANFAFLAN